MPTLAQLQTEVYTWTNRSTLSAETTLALRQAIRAAHKAAKFWRDLVVTTVTGVPVNAVQSLDIPTQIHARFRQAAYVKTPATEQYLDAVAIDDQRDHNGLQKQNIYYGLDTTLAIRAASPADSYEIGAYVYPDITFLSNTANSTDWIFNEHQDFVVLYAASTVLALIGEQEIKSRVDQLMAGALADLRSDNIEIYGR